MKKCFGIDHSLTSIESLIMKILCEKTEFENLMSDLSYVVICNAVFPERDGHQDRGREFRHLQYDKNFDFDRAQHILPYDEKIWSKLTSDR